MSLLFLFYLVKSTQLNGAKLPRLSEYKGWVKVKEKKKITEHASHKYRYQLWNVYSSIVEQSHSIETIS